MRWPRLVVLLYGVFLIALSVEAYLRVQSKASLIAGGIQGLLVLACFGLIPKNPRVGYIGATLLALAGAGNFLPKFFGPEGKVYPHAVIGFTSLAVAIALSLAHVLAKKSSSAEASAA